MPQWGVGDVGQLRPVWAELDLLGLQEITSKKSDLLKCSLSVDRNSVTYLLFLCIYFNLNKVGFIFFIFSTSSFCLALVAKLC